jgi:glycogen operon protein
LARQFHEVDRLSAFFELVNQDPIVSQVKLIAEPWDVGEGGYQVGNFPPLWTEWNGRYRDTVRDFWRGEPASLAEFASRFTGSSDLYESDNRRPIASINFITAHDGFTLHDLVSYNEKHNEANGEDGADGESHNRSWNCGAEGPTDDQGIVELRERQKRNFLTTLLLSQGVPMIAHGDELGRGQQGNNNVYCQDNELSWVDWSHLDIQLDTHLDADKDAAEDTDPRQSPGRALTQFTARVAALRAAHPIFRRQRFFQGRTIRGSNVEDIAWLRPDGQQMSDEDWDTGYARSVAVFLNGQGIPDRDALGERVLDDSFLLLINAHHEPVTFTLPDTDYGRRWSNVLDTADPGQPCPTPEFARPGQRHAVPDRSLRILRAHP